MAFIRCESGGGGAVVATATLWTNTSPSNDFAAQTITLNDSIQNFDLIEIHFKATKAAGSPEGSVVYHVSDIVKYKGEQITSSNDCLYMVLGGRVSAGYWCSRPILYVDDTSFNVRTCGRLGNPGVAQPDNVTSALIPVSITGIKYSS